MKKIILISLVSIFCALQLAAQTTTHSFTYGGQTRNYRLHLPPNFTPSQQFPLVLNLHGLGSTGQQQEFYSAFNTLADTAGIIVVYPDAINNQWNIQATGTPDDVGFISALIDTLHAGYNIDLGRVYSIGMSMGGYMSFTLACKLSCRIAAIASVTGLLNPNPLMTCNLNRKVPAVQIHGTSDPTVPYSGVAATISSWLSKNNCPTTPVVTNYPNTNTTDGCTATENYYGLCADSAIVLQVTINQGGHTWPDASIDIAVTNRDFNANRLIWNFLNKYSTKANLSISGLADSYCSNDNAVTLSAVPAGGSFSGNGVSGSQFNPSSAGSGTHDVVYTLTQGNCSYTTHKSVVVDDCTGIDDVSLFDKLIIYPNPALDNLNVQYKLSTPTMLLLSLFDLNGKEILRREENGMQSGVVLLDIRNVSAGVYYLELTAKGDKVIKRVTIGSK